MTPTITFVLTLVVTLAGGTVERTPLVSPFTNLTACVIVGGILDRRELTAKIPEDAESAHMECVKTTTHTVRPRQESD